MIFPTDDKVLKAWLLEPQRGSRNVLFPNRQGHPLTIHGVQYLLNKHQQAAAKQCPSLKQHTSDGASAEAHNGN